MLFRSRLGLGGDGALCVVSSLGAPPGKGCVQVRGSKLGALGGLGGLVMVVSTRFCKAEGVPVAIYGGGHAYYILLD